MRGAQLETTERPDLSAIWERYEGGHTMKSSQLCPFHADTEPSCSVSWDRGLWNCHTCGKGGDAWNFIMEKEGVSFKDALVIAASNGFSAGAPVELSTRFGTKIKSRSKHGTVKKFKPSFRR